MFVHIGAQSETIKKIL